MNVVFWRCRPSHAEHLQNMLGMIWTASSGHRWKFIVSVYGKRALSNIRCCTCCTKIWRQSRLQSLSLYCLLSSFKPSVKAHRTIDWPAYICSLTSVFDIEPLPFVSLTRSNRENSHSTVGQKVGTVTTSLLRYSNDSLDLTLVNGTSAIQVHQYVHPSNNKLSHSTWYSQRCQSLTYLTWVPSFLAW